jgi:MtfA peptidase
MSDFFSRRRKHTADKPFPPPWRAIVARHVPYARRLTPVQRTELEQHIRAFIERKHFEGCGGLKLHDVHRVTIAAHAALLMLGGNTDGFARLRTILVYPDEYVVDEPRAIGGGIVSEGPEVHAGHTQSNLGAIVVSWRDVLDGISDPADGQNVLFHELAHQLDFEDGDDNGVPRHADAASARRFAEVARRAYERLRADVRGERDTLLDPYGAENPVEFFAVSTEAFFEMPAELRAEHPELYEVLAAYFRQDPAADSSASTP